MHGQFQKATEKVKGNKSWDWLKKGYLKKETENTIIAAQDQALCTENMRKTVYGENVDSTCRVSGSANETVAHIAAECQKLAQKKYKQVRHDNVAKVIKWKLCKKWGFEKSDQWYTHKSEKVLESEECKILWDFPYRPPRHWSTTDLISLQLRKRLRNAFSSTQHSHLTLVLALGTVTKQFEKWMQKLDLEITVEMLQKPCLLGTARIIRKVLDMK